LHAKDFGFKPLENVDRRWSAMTTALEKKMRRPSWMTPFGEEGLGDVFFDRLWPEWRRDMGEEWTPTVDLFEKEGNYHLKAELPGFNKEDISVSLSEGTVTLTGKKESSHEEKTEEYHIKEMSSGSFTRSFELPGEVDEEKIDANYKDGVLTVIMPKKNGSKAKRIEVH
jgi:HSP20 family protein